MAKKPAKKPKRKRKVKASQRAPRARASKPAKKKSSRRAKKPKKSAKKKKVTLRKGKVPRSSKPAKKPAKKPRGASQPKITKPTKPGRPRKYSTPAEMQKAIDEYFEENSVKPTICGLALALGFCERKSLIDYEGYGKGFLHTIKKAKLRVEASYEETLRSSHYPGAIFALKNFGWSDKQEIIGPEEGPIPINIVYFNKPKKGM